MHHPLLKFVVHFMLAWEADTNNYHVLDPAPYPVDTVVKRDKTIVLKSSQSSGRGRLVPKTRRLQDKGQRHLT